MGSRTADFRGLALPALIAVALTLVYFALTGGWDRLATPIPGIVSVVAGVIGTVVGLTLDRRRRATHSEPAAPTASNDA